MLPVTSYRRKSTMLPRSESRESRLLHQSRFGPTTRAKTIGPNHGLLEPIRSSLLAGPSAFHVGSPLCPELRHARTDARRLPARAGGAAGDLAGERAARARRHLQASSN